MNLRFTRVAQAATLFATLTTAGVASAQGISAPSLPPNPGATAPNPGTAPGSDRVTAALVLRELRQLGVTGEVGADSRGDPRIDAAVDNYKWVIFFYGCATDGELEARPCGSLQFFSGYTMSNPISALTTNKFNAENRYVRTYTAVVDSRYAARISMDVMFANTGGDPARMFRAHFAMMKYQAVDFRKLINFK